MNHIPVVSLDTYNGTEAPQRIVEGRDDQSNSLGLLMYFWREGENIDVEFGLFGFYPGVDVIVGEKCLGNYGRNIKPEQKTIMYELDLINLEQTFTHEIVSKAGRPISFLREILKSSILSLNRYASCKSCSFRYATDLAFPARNDSRRWARICTTINSKAILIMQETHLCDLFNWCVNECVWHSDDLEGGCEYDHFYSRVVFTWLPMGPWVTP